MVYDSFFCYLIFWVFGAWMAERLKTGRTASSGKLIGLGIAGLLLQIAVVMALPVRAGRFVSMLMLAASFGALITGFARRDRERAGTPRQYWLARVGELSYSLYAFHAPLMAVALMLALRGNTGGMSPTIAFAILCMPVVLGSLI